MHAEFNNSFETKMATAPKIAITSKADTWSIGVEAYRIFTRAAPLDDPSLSTIQNKLITFASDSNNRLQVPGNVDVGLSAPDRSHFNTMLGQLMHPDPAQRPTLSQILQNLLFQLPGVGSQAARDVIKQV